jgi:hypothetical protein
MVDAEVEEVVVHVPHGDVQLPNELGPNVFQFCSA